MHLASQKLDFARRLHHPWQYRRFFDGSEVFRLRECMVYRIANEVGHFRLGITLKARGSSIDRNKVKRQIREFFRSCGDLLGSYDYNVVIPKIKKMTHPYPQRLRVSLEEQFLVALNHPKKPPKRPFP